jgi:hypothetical protein
MRVVANNRLSRRPESYSPTATSLTRGTTRELAILVAPRVNERVSHIIAMTVANLCP